MGIRLKDVAHAAGVGVSTVSKVLNGYTDIAPATREKVLAVADAIGYRPRITLSDRVQALNSIGLIINQSPELFSTTPFVHNVLASLRSVASNLNTELRLYPFEVSGDSEDDFARSISASTVDGIMLIKAQDPLPLHTIRSLQRKDIPLVIIGTTELNDELDVSSVSPNNMLAAHRVVHYLYSLGHRRIHFLSESKLHPGFKERYEGYCRAMKRLNLPLAPEDDAVFQSRTDALKSLEKLILREDRPTAVFACNDELASDILRATRKHGLSVPQDLSVVGFDGFGLAQWLDPPLTTNQLPCLEMARLAFAELQRLSGYVGPARVRYSVSCHLVIRGSTASLRC